MKNARERIWVQQMEYDVPEAESDTGFFPHESQEWMINRTIDWCWNYIHPLSEKPIVGILYGDSTTKEQVIQVSFPTEPDRNIKFGRETNRAGIDTFYVLNQNATENIYSIDDNLCLDREIEKLPPGPFFLTAIMLAFRPAKTFCTTNNTASPMLLEQDYIPFFFAPKDYFYSHAMKGVNKYRMGLLYPDSTSPNYCRGFNTLAHDLGLMSKLIRDAYDPAIVLFQNAIKASPARDSFCRNYELSREGEYAIPVKVYDPTIHEPWKYCEKWDELFHGFDYFEAIVILKYWVDSLGYGKADIVKFHHGGEGIDWIREARWMRESR